MLRGSIVRQGVAAAAAFLLVLGMGQAMAQQEYSTGGTPTPPEIKQSIPEAPVFRDFLPQAVDLSRYFPPVGDQANQGSCVGWATAYAARAYYAQQVERLDNTQPQNIPSPGWVFNLIHLGPDCNGGAYIPDAMQVLMGGAPSFAEFPYDDTKCPRPLPPARAKASGFKIDNFELVWDQAKPDLDKVKGALAKGNPVVIIASLDPSFFDLNPRNSIWRADASAKAEGGHAVAIVGYDDATQTFKFINSWTTGWGDKGYGRMTYETFAARVYEGYIMHMPGDPEILLAETDFSADPVDVTPPTPPFKPPLILKPSDDTRDFAAANVPVDVGALACGKVDITTDADGNSIATGFVGTQEELDRVEEALKGKVDDTEVSIAPWPACEVRMTLAAGLAETDAPQLAIDPAAPKVGDQLAIGIETPGFASYLYAAYFAADGTVINLAQPNSADLKAKAGHTVIRLGGAGGSEALTVAPPVGDEMLLVVASEKPLFASARADNESNRDFLSGLRQAVLAGDAGRITASIMPVTTVQ